MKLFQFLMRRLLTVKKGAKLPKTLAAALAPEIDQDIGDGNTLSVVYLNGEWISGIANEDGDWLWEIDASKPTREQALAEAVTIAKQDGLYKPPSKLHKVRSKYKGKKDKKN